MVPVVVLALAFVLALAWRHRVELGELLLGARPWGLALSMSLLLVSNAFAAVMFGHLSRRAGASARPGLLAGSFLFSQMAKYIPGRIWGMVLQKGVVGAGMGTFGLALANIELSLVVLFANVGIGLSTLAWLEWGGMAGMLGLVLLSASCGAALMTRASTRLVHAIARVLGREASTVAPREPDRSVREILRLWGAVVGFVLTLFLGWLTFLAWGLDIESVRALVLMAALSAASIAGTLSMLPGGIGVREAVVMSFSGLGVDAGTLASIALSTRMCILVVDLASSLVGFAVVRSSHRSRG